MVSVVILGGGLGASEADDDLVSLNSTDYGIQRNMIALELERMQAVSKVKIIGGAAGDTLFDVRTFCQIAKARGCRYYVVLSAEECGDFSWTYYIGFTNTQTPDIIKEFGAAYSELDESGKKRTVVKVADYDVKLGVKSWGAMPPGFALPVERC